MLMRSALVCSTVRPGNASTLAQPAHPKYAPLPWTTRAAFSGDLRTDIILSEFPPYLDLRARRIVFPAQTTDMTVRAVEFNYNLVAMSETRQANYQFTYDPANDEWTIVSDLN